MQNKFKCPFTPAIIDFSQLPNIPKGCTIHSHNVRSLGKQRVCDLEFYLPSVVTPVGPKYPNGADVYHKYSEQPTFPANLLDHFLGNPEDIPDEFKGNGGKKKYVFFFDTIYLNEQNYYFVRGIYFDGKKYKEITFSFDPSNDDKDSCWNENCCILIAA